MKQATMGWLIAAGLLILLGGICFVGVMWTLQWDFTRLSTVSYTTKDYAVQQPYDSLLLEVGDADVTLVPSEEGTTVTCMEQEHLRHTVTVEEGNLTIQVKDTRPWYAYIGIYTKSPQITVALPRGEYEQLTIQGHTGDVTIPEGYAFKQGRIALSTGDIRVTGITAESLQLSVSTGQITANQVVCREDMHLRVSTGDAAVNGVTCRRFTSLGNTGDLTLTQLQVAESLSVTRTTGDVTLSACDAKTLTLQTDTGDVTGTLLSSKEFEAFTSTGRIQLPPNGGTGTCHITTSTGDIKMAILP